MLVRFEGETKLIRCMVGGFTPKDTFQGLLWVGIQELEEYGDIRAERKHVVLFYNCAKTITNCKRALFQSFEELIMR